MADETHDPKTCVGCRIAELLNEFVPEGDITAIDKVTLEKLVTGLGMAVGQLLGVHADPDRIFDFHKDVFKIAATTRSQVGFVTMLKSALAGAEESEATPTKAPLH